MITLDLKSLVAKLNNPIRNALEGAAGLCMARTHYNVEIEHWLLKLLEIPDTDLASILNRFDIDIGKFTRELNRELDSIKTGNTRAPALSPNIVDLTKTAWMLASVEYGHPQTTSAHILGALMLDEGLNRSTSVTGGELKKIAPESLRDVIRAIVGSTNESLSNVTANDSARHAASGPTGTPSLTLNKGRLIPFWGEMRRSDRSLTS
ncbi:MAG: Clp protease N-terminal domain-containing protein [Pseudomonadota bacterium]